MQTKIIAHRGASAHAPENTMHAFKKAQELHANGIETDIHLTKDDIPVLMHDEKINRTSNGKGFIRNYTYEQLLQFDLGSWFSSSFAHTKIVTLDEFLSWMQETKLQAHIELKNNKIDYPRIEEIVYNCIQTHSMGERAIISSFNYESTQRFKALSSTIEVAYLTSKMNREKRSKLQAAQIDALHIKYSLLRKKMIHWSTQKQLPLRIFTVNTIAHIMHCFDAGVEGIYTDDPGLAYETLLNWKSGKD